MTKPTMQRKAGAVSDVEDFKPIPIRRDVGLAGRMLFALRMTADLQLLTCMRFLDRPLGAAAGDVLDVGCGEMPFRFLLGPHARYIGIDVPQADDFGMRRHRDILPFNGKSIPFPDASFDQVLCTEVLEHAEDPVGLVSEMHRVLRPGGRFIATVPFAARVHHAPHDFHRFTRYRLVTLFAAFEAVDVAERGDDLAVIANKMIIVCARLVKFRRWQTLLPRVIAFAVLMPFAAVALAVAHLSLIFGWGSRMDPLGYAILARKA